MLQPFPVVLAEYDPGWPRLAAALSRRLDVLGDVLCDVHHIGSTSVPGLAAKPIIDLLPVVTDLDLLDERQAIVEGLGYGWHGEYGLTGRRYCTLDNRDGRRIVQLHFFAEGSPAVARHLAFRDYLRCHPEVCRQYEREKHKARALHTSDSHGYADAKAAWIEAVEAIALEWRQSATSEGT